jgi:hypothetical protein
MSIASPGWLNILNASIPKYFREVEVNILRERILLAMLESRGRVTTGHSGTKFNWRVKYKRNTLTPYADGDVLTFARVNRHKQAEVVNDRGYVSPESMGHIDTRQNSGQEAIVNLWSEKNSDIEEDLRENFCDQLYIDGYASGNGRRIMGVESCLGSDGTGLAPGFAKPSDTYADISTIPGNYGGNWSNGTYPEGSGDAQYDFWSPILVDYTSEVANAYTSSDRIWANTCNEALRRLITYCRRQKSKKGMLDLVMIELELFRQFKDFQEQYKQIPVVAGEALAMRNLGFDVLSLDGATLSTEFGMPTGTGYGFNIDHMELCSMNETVFRTIGPIYNEETDSYRWSVSFLGNTKLNPRFLGKLKNYGIGS